MTGKDIRCPKCGSINIDKYWGHKLIKGGAEFVGGFLEGYIFGGSGETGGEIAAGIVDKIFQKYECKNCGYIFTEEVLGNKIHDNNDETVCQGKTVEYIYQLFDDSNSKLLFEATKESPDVMIYGENNEVVPGLQAALKGLRKGDRFSVTLPPRAAFGERNPEYELSLDPEIFIRDGKLAEEVSVGAILPMMSAEGYRIEGEVIEIGDKIKMDFNHPFAGLTVRYEGEIVGVRNTKPSDFSN